MQTEEKVAVQSNLINVVTVTTRGEQKTIQVAPATKWSALKSELKKLGYETNNMKFVESIKKTTLEHDDAIIPEESFYLFMMPYKNKSGVEKKVATKKDAPAKKAAVKKAAPKKAAAKKAAPAKKAATKKAVAPKKAKAIAEVVETVAKAKELPAIDAQAEIRNLAKGLSDVKSF